MAKRPKSEVNLTSYPTRKNESRSIMGVIKKNGNQEWYRGYTPSLVAVARLLKDNIAAVGWEGPNILIIHINK